MVAIVADRDLEPSLSAVREEGGDPPGVSAVRSSCEEQLRLQA
jgi:hypothetical protein